MAKVRLFWRLAEYDEDEKLAGYAYASDEVELPITAKAFGMRYGHYGDNLGQRESWKTGFPECVGAELVSDMPTLGERRTALEAEREAFGKHLVAQALCDAERLQAEEEAR